MLFAKQKEKLKISSTSFLGISSTADRSGMDYLTICANLFARISWVLAKQILRTAIASSLS